MTPVKIPARFDDHAAGFLKQLDAAVTATAEAMIRFGDGADSHRQKAAACRSCGNAFDAARYEGLAMMFERDPRLPAAYDMRNSALTDGTTRYFLHEYIKLLEGATTQEGQG